MKIKPEHYKRLEIAINQAKDFVTWYPEKSDEYNRWRLWDKACDKDQYTLARELWEYLNDNNIDTALKKILGS